MCGAVALVLATNPAAARVRVGVVIGVPGPWYPYPHYYDPHYYYPPPYYYPSPYYYPPVVTVPVAPPTYIQQPSQQETNDGDWYYCAAKKAYYPYVKQCPDGWLRVAPKPPGAP